MKKTRIKSEDLVHISLSQKYFGTGWSRRTVERMIDSGELKESVHYVNDSRPSSKLRNIKLVISEIEKLRSIPIHKR